MTGSGGASTGGSGGAAGGAPAAGSGSGGTAAGTGGAAGSAGRGGLGGRAGAGGAAGQGGVVGGAGREGNGNGGNSATAEPFKGVANSPCAARKALNVSWYYNWTQSESEPCSDGGGGVFVPMIWGHAGNEQSATGITASVSAFAGKHQTFVLGFNEPDNATQSNIAVATAVNLWPAFLGNTSIQVVSPATQANTTGQSWFSSFMTQVNSGGLRVDVVGLHWYGWNAGSCEPTAATLESYIKWAEGITGSRPIWLTEWGCLNASAPDTQTVVSFLKGAVAMFARHPRIRRYAWYPWATNHALVNADGSLTDLGKAFAALPATH